MSLDPAVPLAALQTLVQGVSGIQAVYSGFPEALGNRVCAIVLLDAADPDDKTTGGLLRVRVRLQVILTYRLDGAEATAESTLATAAGAFWLAFYANRTLGDTWSEGYPAAQPSLPSYSIVAGQELRLMPLAVQGALLSTYSLNQP